MEEEFTHDFMGSKPQRYDVRGWNMSIKSKFKTIKYNTFTCERAKELTLILAEKIPELKDNLLEMAEGMSENV